MCAVREICTLCSTKQPPIRLCGPLVLESLVAFQESVKSFEKRSSSLELELSRSKNDSDDTSKKLHEVQEKYSELEQNLQW